MTNPLLSEKLVIQMDNYIEPEEIVDSDEEEDDEVAVKWGI